ncbi:MAG: hypothetical protein OXH57_05765, partial [Ekhidna sp.]|nr:hypothetical protein [Ekhidna sp.]
MELGTINQIRAKRDSIREQIKSLNLSDQDSETYGNENEYTFKGIIAGIEELLTDISTLTKYPQKFIKVSTYDERISIQSYLDMIDNDLEIPNNYISHFENLKILIRNYNVKNISERQIEFENEIEEVRKVKIQLQQMLVETKELKDNIESESTSVDKKFEQSNQKLQEIESELESILERKNELIEESGDLETINTELKIIQANATENLIEITESLNESKSNEKLITSFANKVQDREKRLDLLEQKTQENNLKLDDYEKERKSILQEAKELIESSKKALNYKTAEGISASFQSQYDSANNKRIFGSWIVGAVFCVLGTLGLGMWILQAQSDNIGILIGRISLLPLLVTGAVFCAKQYS